MATDKKISNLIKHLTDKLARQEQAVKDTQDHIAALEAVAAANAGAKK